MRGCYLIDQEFAADFDWEAVAGTRCDRILEVFDTYGIECTLLAFAIAFAGCRCINAWMFGKAHTIDCSEFGLFPWHKLNSD